MPAWPQTATARLTNHPLSNREFLEVPYRRSHIGPPPQPDKPAAFTGGLLLRRSQLRSITVPTVSPVFWRHLRQRRTPGRFSKWKRLSRRAAVRAGKAVSPAGLLQVGGAGRIIGEKSLELG